MKVKYTGTDERVFPTLGITAKPGDEFDAPEDFVAPNVEAAKGSVAPKVTATPSAASDTKVGE